MVAEVFPYGNWKSLIEVEEVLTVEELELILSKVRDAEHERQKFAAALKGVNLDEISNEEAEASFDEIKRRAEAKLAGKSEEQLAFEELGIDVEVVDE